MFRPSDDCGVMGNVLVLHTCDPGLIPSPGQLVSSTSMSPIAPQLSFEFLIFLLKKCEFSLLCAISSHWETQFLHKK